MRFGQPGGFCCLDSGFLRQHAVVEGVGVHLDGFVDGLGTGVGGEVAEGFEESLCDWKKEWRCQQMLFIKSI